MMVTLGSYLSTKNKKNEALPRSIDANGKNGVPKKQQQLLRARQVFSITFTAV